MDIEMDKDDLDLISTYEKVDEFLKYLNNNIIEIDEEEKDEQGFLSGPCFRRT